MSPGEWIPSSKRFGVSGSAGVRHDHRDVPEVRRVVDRRPDADLQRHADDGERVNAAVAQRDIKRRAHKRGHRDLIEDRLARARRNLGHELKLGGVTLQARLQVGHAVHPLPGQRSAQLGNAGDLFRQPHVPGEEGANARVTGGL